MGDATLSPGELLDALQPAVQLDDELIDGWSLTDVYRLDDTAPVQVELSGAGQRVLLDVEPEVFLNGGPRALASAAGLRIGYRPGAADEAGVAGCHALAAVLESRLGRQPRRWSLAPAALSELATAIADEVSWRLGSLGDDPDASLLRRDFDHYERLYGVRPQARTVRVCGRRVPGVSVHYPPARDGRVPTSAAVYPVSSRVAYRRRMRSYFGRLGVVFDDRAFARTVPTPASYRQTAQRQRLAPIRPRIVAGLTSSLAPGVWGAFARRGLFPVSVAPRWAIEVHRRVRDIALLSNIPCDAGMVVHDVGLHVLAMHAIPPAGWRRLASVAAGQVRRRPWRLLSKRLAEFFEGPLTRTCWQLWSTIAEPEDFAGAFVAELDALCQQLAST